MKFFIFIFILPFLILNISCQKETVVDPYSSLQGTANPIPFSDYAWVQSCKSATGNTSYSAIFKFNEVSKEFEYQTSIYSDSSCITKVVQGSVKGSFELSNMKGINESYVAYKPSMAIYTSYDIDWKYSQITYTPVNATYVSMLNSQQFCGYSNWSLNTAYDVSGKVCSGLRLPTQGSVDYDIVEMYFKKDSDPLFSQSINTLFFGYSESGHDGSSATARRRAFNTGIGYLKSAF